MNLWDAFILNPMVNALLVLYGWLGNNFTLSITVFTILIRVLTFPLTMKQQQSTKAMQDLQKSKEWTDLQKKHAKDKAALQQAQMKLYQEKGISPLAGCLPTIIQLPILFGLYRAIMLVMATTPLQLFDLSLRVYPFLPHAASLMPINNLFLWLNLGQPDQYYVLPVLVAVTTWLQQKLITPPTGDAQSNQMAQSMALTMPLMFGFFALSFPSGLSVYFIVSNVVGIAQYAFMGNLQLPEFIQRYLPPSLRALPAKSSPAKASAKK
jgi:YidC/Oxa1 family membrane protein insertase